MTLGPVATLVTLGMAAGALAILVVGVNGWSRYRRSRRGTSPDEGRSLEGCPRYRRYVLAAVAAGGSARDWDYSVRPVLGDLVEAAFAEDRPGAGPGSAARVVLGDDTWDLVDPERTLCDDRTQPGPGHESLLEILAKLESGAVARH
jgi:hypothetical protein